MHVFLIMLILEIDIKCKQYSKQLLQQKQQAVLFTINSWTK
jgi:hypothetical protein